MLCESINSNGILKIDLLNSYFQVDQQAISETIADLRKELRMQFGVRS
jgi:hypothetical protein